MISSTRVTWLSLLAVAALLSAAQASDVLAPVSARYAPESIEETPSFQRHVLPLMGRLGCNGRACHGSFQGQGGFRLSLFGYDFNADHEALLAKADERRVNVDAPGDSLILTKPTSEDEHEGGKRYATGGWEHHLLRRWIETGAKNDGHEVGELVKLEVTPAEIVFAGDKDTVQLQVVAHWSDGTIEDVTPICRFQTNDDAVATIDAAGVVTSKGVGDTHIVAFYDNGITPVPVMLPVSPETAKNYPQIATSTKIDELVLEKLKKLGVVPSQRAGDAEFLRRASLDITGTLPSPAEIEAFLTSDKPNKRAEKIDELLERPGYAAWWATKFSDWTGNSAANAGNNNFRNEESRLWYAWLRHRIDENVPYDEIIEGIVLATSRRENQSYEDYCQEMGTYYRSQDPADFAQFHSLPQYWTRRNLRMPEEKALSFAHAFMGVRIQCAQCHKHPFDQWSQNDFEQFTAFFGGLQYGNRQEDKELMAKMNEKLGVGDKKGGDQRKGYPQFLNEGKVIPFQELYVNSGKRYVKKDDAAKAKDKKNRKQRTARRVITPKLLGGDEIVEKEYGDPRAALMEWLRAEDNPYFAKALVNRVWANYFHRGIIEPADDLNLANPPSNAPLLDWLTQGFIDSGYDLKWLHRTIATSDTYQRSWVPNETNRLDERNFSRAVPRRLPAEVVYDALQMATASDDVRAQLEKQLADRAIGPSAGYQNRKGAYALAAFGKPARVENCDCERSFEPSLLQVLFTRNDQESLAMIERRGGWVEQIAKANKINFRAADAKPGRDIKGREARQLAQTDKQLNAIDKQLKKLRKEGKNEEADKIAENRKKLNRRAARLREAVASQEKKQEVANEKSAAEGEATAQLAAPELKVIDEQGPQLVRDAYLRTVSRTPDERELARSLDYLRQSPALDVGLRDLMWALVNTKEFIVNH